VNDSIAQAVAADCVETEVVAAGAGDMEGSALCAEGVVLVEQAAKQVASKQLDRSEDRYRINEP
jgi:hypothetical protein